MNLFLIANLHHILNVVCFLLGDSPESEFYMPTDIVFRNIGICNSDTGESPRRKHTTEMKLLHQQLLCFGLVDYDVSEELSAPLFRSWRCR
jgi:hypothetical protein